MDYFSGTIPTNLFNLQQPEILWLNHSDFTGSIPTRAGKLSEIEKLYLAESYITGSLLGIFAKIHPYPDYIPEIPPNSWNSHLPRWVS